MYWINRTPNLLQELERIQDEMTHLLNVSNPRRTQTAPSYPALNAWVDEETALITAELPGVDPEDIDLSIVGDSLVLKGMREPDQMGEDARYHRRERGYGQFTRTIELPFLVEIEDVEATFDNGVLTISLPRAEADKPKKISIKATA